MAAGTRPPRVMATRPLNGPRSASPPRQRPGVAMQLAHDTGTSCCSRRCLPMDQSPRRSGLPDGDAALTPSTDAMKFVVAHSRDGDRRIMGFELTPAFLEQAAPDHSGQHHPVRGQRAGHRAARRNLQKKHQKPAILIGSAGAIVLRIIFVLDHRSAPEDRLPEAGRRPAAAVDRRQAGAGREEGGDGVQGGRLAMGGRAHHHHRRRRR